MTRKKDLSFEQTSEEGAHLDTHKGRENLSEGSTDAVLPLKDPDSALIRNDPELKELATHLEMTAPADLAFRESLLSRMLSILKEHQASQTSETMAYMGYEELSDRNEKAK